MSDKPEPFEPTSSLGRLRKEQAEARTPREIGIQKEPDVWRGTCPACQAPLVVMSEILPNIPRRTPPDVGDVIRCDSCATHSKLVEVNARTFRVRLQAIELPGFFG